MKKSLGQEHSFPLHRYCSPREPLPCCFTSGTQTGKFSVCYFISTLIRTIHIYIYIYIYNLLSYIKIFLFLATDSSWCEIRPHYAKNTGASGYTEWRSFSWDHSGRWNVARYVYHRYHFRCNYTTSFFHAIFLYILQYFVWRMQKIWREVAKAQS